MLLSAFVLVACSSDKDGAADATAAGRLDGPTFLSQSIDGHVLVPGTQIRLSVDRDQIGAHAGCNSLSAAYQVRDGRLLVVGDGMTATDMGCDPPRHAQDEWLSGFLRSTPRIDLDGDTLTLATADAAVLLVDRVVADIEVDVKRDTVRFGEFVIDTIGCPPPWDATVELLRAGDARYSITAARLTLTASDVGIAAVAD